MDKTPEAATASPHLLFILDSLRPGGAERQLLYLIKAIKKQEPKFRLSLLALSPGSLQSELPLNDLEKVYVLHKRSKWDLWHLLRECARILKNTQPDLVHSWLPYSSLLVNLSLSLNLSYFHHPRPFVWVSSVRVSPKIYPQKTWRQKQLAYWTFDRPQLSSDLVVCNSWHVSQELRQRTYPEAKLCSVPNAIDLEAFQEKLRQPASKEKNGQPLLVSVGRLEHQKGFSYLLDALPALQQHYPKLKLWILGEGPLRPTLESQIQRRQLQETVELLGFQQSVASLVSQADLFLLPSLFEGMPNAIMEAMALSKTILATAVDGTQELLRHNQEGWLVPPANSQALTEAIKHLLQDPDLAHRLALAARQRLQLYTPATVAGQYLEIYERLLGKRKR